MEELARELLGGIDMACLGFHYYKDPRAMKWSKELNEKIQQFCSYFLKGNQFGMEEEEYTELCTYVFQTLSDYTEAFEQNDVVLMLDTLDYGLRELLKIYIDENTEEAEHE